MHFLQHHTLLFWASTLPLLARAQNGAELIFCNSEDGTPVRTTVFGTELAAFATELEANPAAFNIPSDGVELVATTTRSVSSSGVLSAISEMKFCMTNSFLFDNTHVFPSTMAAAIRVLVDQCCGGQENDLPCGSGFGRLQGDTGLDIDFNVVAEGRPCPR